MSISNGQTIVASDVNSAFTSSLSSLRTDNAYLPTLFWLPVRFDNIVSGTASVWLSQDIVLPDDYILADVAILGGEHNGTVTVSVNNSALIVPISMTATLGANYVAATRYYTTTTNPVQLFLKGSTVRVTVSTTNVVATSTLTVSLGFYSKRRTA
jgi:hypothetical protein